VPVHVVILILKSAYWGGGSRMPFKGIFAFLAFDTAQHSINRTLSDSNLAVGWSDIGRGCAAVCRGNCYVLGLFPQ